MMFCFRVIAFGFVFIHPLEDGNGRIHRFLIHHELAQSEFLAQGFFFPVSAVMFDRITDYQKVLQLFSKPRLGLVKWKSTFQGNVEVINETIDLYRYFDATKQAEFLYSCIKETIEKTLPEEIDYLNKHDEMKRFLNNFLDMPDRLMDLMIRFLIQTNGRFSKRAKNKEFSALTEEEISMIESKYAEVFLSDSIVLGTIG